MLHAPHSRTILSLSGSDAPSFLQGLTTQDVSLLSSAGLHLCAFLSPQGKLLYDALGWKESDTIFLDTNTTQAESLLAYLTRYKLRAKLNIAPTAHSVQLLPPESAEGFADPRSPHLPRRLYHQSSINESSIIESSGIDYHALRTSLAIPEAAYDTAGEDVAMDMGYDALGAISFTKGCYIGQEITARMHYKHILRKAVLAVSAQAPLPHAEGNIFSPIAAGEVTLGTLRSHTGTQGLALIKLDAWEDAVSQQLPITLGTIPINLAWPEWAATKREVWGQAKQASAS